MLAAEKYLNSQTIRKSLADNFDLPSIEGYDKEVLLATIIRNYSTLPCLYEDPEYFYEECDYWWRSHKNNYAKMFSVIEAEYNPLENYDRHETIEVKNDNTTINALFDSKSGTDINKLEMTGNMTNTDTGHIKDNGSDKIENGVTTTNYGKTSESKVSAYNESNYQPSNKIEDGGSDTTTTNTETVHSNDHELNTENKLNRNATDKNTYEYNSRVDHGGTVVDNGSTITDAHLHGNIGVTKSQEMLTDELRVRLLSVYTIIANQFADEMLLGIW